MDENRPSFPEGFEHIPGSFFVIEPSAQAIIGGYILWDEVHKITKKIKPMKKITGAIFVILAWFKPNKCHRQAYRDYIRRAWNVEP